MTEENLQLNNPLHGVNLETLLTELIEHYGFEILAEYTNINCFKNRATITSSLKFLKKTEWAREKMERFYLYNYKNLPKADDTQYEITPRQRVIPEGQKPREPKVLIAGQAPDPTVRKNTNNNFRRSHDNKSNFNNRPAKAHTEKPKSAKSNTSTSSSDPWANAPK